MQKTVKVRVGDQKWNNHIRKVRSLFSFILSFIDLSLALSPLSPRSLSSPLFRFLCYRYDLPPSPYIYIYVYELTLGSVFQPESPSSST